MANGVDKSDSSKTKKNARDKDTLSSEPAHETAQIEKNTHEEAALERASVASAHGDAQNNTRIQTSESIDFSTGAQAIGASAALISICTIISRITGFIRTWAMAFALGSTLLSSAYQVANNLPSMIYELVIGGMVVTAFLPVYVSVKKKLGNEAGCEYASNLLTITLIVLGIVSAFCIAFPSLIIYTQSFFSDQSTMTSAVFLFQIFAIQIVFYGISSVLSGLLNANRDYLWSSIAPVANNVVVIVSFLLYAALCSEHGVLALYILAVGNPLGVFVQMAMQWPALKANGITLKWHLNLKDPSLRDTVSIGAPAVLVMAISLVIVSVQNAAAYSFSDNGPSILAYARLWYTFPYSFLAVPITTAMFTELSVMQAEKNTEGIQKAIVSGANQILFFMIPCALYLIVFATPLVTLYHAGAFTLENVGSIASYLCALALSLPLYSVLNYLQKVFSSIRHMGVFTLMSVAAGAIQILLTVTAALTQIFPIESIALAGLIFYIACDFILFAYLKKNYPSMDLFSIVRTCMVSTVLGIVGALAGAGTLLLLEHFVSPLSGGIAQAFMYVVIAGLIAIAFTYVPAMKMKLPEAAFVSDIAKKLKAKLTHG